MFSYGGQRRCERAWCYAGGGLPGVHVNPFRSITGSEPPRLIRTLCLQALRRDDHPVLHLLPDGRVGRQYMVSEVTRWVDMVSASRP